MTTTEIKPGQRWRDRDPRCHGRTVSIIRVENGRVYYTYVVHASSRVGRFLKAFEVHASSRVERFLKAFEYVEG